MSSRYCAEPLVSIVICVYNAGVYLAEAVASALRQSYENIEIIIIDDGSTDGAVARLREQLTDPRIRWYEQPNAGKPTALNRALSEIRGEYYAVLDADDTNAPTRIETQLRCLLENPDVAAVYCGHEIIFRNHRVAPRFRSKTREQCRADIELFRMPAHDPTAMYRVDMVRHVRYDESLVVAQGYDYILRIGEQLPMLVVGETLYGYRVHRGSVTKRDPGRRQRLVREVLRTACQRRGLDYTVVFPRNFNSERMRSRVADNNLASDFLESAIDLRRAGQLAKAIRTGFQCVGMHPADPHHYKALVYALAPPAWTDAVRARREARRRARMLVKR